MTLPTKAFLVIGLLLTSAEALAQNDTVAWSDGHSSIQRAPDQYRPVPRGVDDQIRTAHGKRPVDVLSLSLGGALACFFAIAMWRRRKSLRARGLEPEIELPAARAVTLGDHTRE